MRLAGPAVAGVTTFEQGYEVSCSTEFLFMATLSIEELTSCVMSFMILAGGIRSVDKRFSQRITATLLTEVDLNFRTWIQGLVKGFKVKERKGKHKVRHEIKKPNDKIN